MRIEDRDEFVDLVGLVVARVLSLQKEQAQAKAVVGDALIPNGNGPKEETHAGE